MRRRANSRSNNNSLVTARYQKIQLALRALKQITNIQDSNAMRASSSIKEQNNSVFLEFFVFIEELAYIHGIKSIGLFLFLNLFNSLAVIWARI